MKLEDKITLVKNEILNKFPNCHYTIRILMWDDGTDLVECRHGDGEKIYNVTYYNNSLNYNEFIMLSNNIRIDETGNEFYVLTPEEYQTQMNNG